MTEPTRTETIVCFGTSITFGTPYVSREDAWPAILERRLNQRFGAAGVQVTCINSGVPGHNTAEGLERIQSDVLSHDPDVVIIEFSCNDVRWEPEKRVELEQFRENLLEMVRLDFPDHFAKSRAQLDTFKTEFFEWKAKYYEEERKQEGLAEDLRGQVVGIYIHYSLLGRPKSGIRFIKKHLPEATDWLISHRAEIDSILDHWLDRQGDAPIDYFDAM